MTIDQEVDRTLDAWNIGRISTEEAQQQLDELYDDSSTTIDDRERILALQDIMELDRRSKYHVRVGIRERQVI